jgi:ABC-type Fe3+ transport system permease subunit
MANSSELIRAVRGPIILIALGVLFALDNFTSYGFHQTWPVILIVVGVLTLLARASRAGSSPGTGAGPSPGPTPGGGAS